MKLRNVAAFFSLVTLFLSGCIAAQTDYSTTTIPATTSTTNTVSIPTINVTETTHSTNSLTWETGIREIFEIQCSECHSSTPSGGFSITSYTKVLQGSNLGPIIIPGNPEESHLFYKLKFGGNHPGYMSKEQTDLVREWVSSGAPE
jgi:hypothetical protein